MAAQLKRTEGAVQVALSRVRQALARCVGRGGAGTPAEAVETVR
jgi:hypothetical protein